MGTATQPQQSIKIRNIHQDDYEGWLPLWIDNNNGLHDEEVTNETWMRLNNSIFPVHGFVATLDEEVIGFVHYVLHPVTGHLHQACYMQDLYISPAHRRLGIGQALVESLAAMGKQEEWARLYWLADKKDESVQKFYQTLGVSLDFSFHVHPLT